MVTWWDGSSFFMSKAKYRPAGPPPTMPIFIGFLLPTSCSCHPPILRIQSKHFLPIKTNTSTLSILPRAQHRVPTRFLRLNILIDVEEIARIIAVLEGDQALVVGPVR